MSYFIFHTYMIGSFSPTREDVWEESIRIYREGSLDAAFARASADATADQIEYETVDGYVLSWRIHSVTLVRELEQQEVDGQEVFSRSLTSSEARSLLAAIR